jgi:hypothetical protein
MPPSVDDETSRSCNVHPLVEQGTGRHTLRRQQRIGAEDQQRPCPAGNLDEEKLDGQAASFLST